MEPFTSNLLFQMRKSTFISFSTPDQPATLRVWCHISWPKPVQTNMISPDGVMSCARHWDPGTPAQRVTSPASSASREVTPGPMRLRLVGASCSNSPTAARTICLWRRVQPSRCAACNAAPRPGDAYACGSCRSQRSWHGGWYAQRHSWCPWAQVYGVWSLIHAHVNMCQSKTLEDNHLTKQYESPREKWLGNKMESHRIQCHFHFLGIMHPEMKVSLKREHS